MNYKVSIVIEKDDYGYYAYCPELEGCQTQGDSLDEIMANIKEAIELNSILRHYHLKKKPHA
ncbi:MAG: type II toxin-antitoxin system HicB family antitoxin [Candidatus Methanoperedens sp.]|nr:type II toxin-antitoxin system HicB family antitoxin [Candidatus Methanoperedens sp.]